MSDGSKLIQEQPAPTAERTDKPAVWDLVIGEADEWAYLIADGLTNSGSTVALLLADMQARDAEGRRRYGTPLQPDNGRDPLVDAYQEALDAVVYLRQANWEGVDGTTALYLDQLRIAYRLRGMLKARGQ